MKIYVSLYVDFLLNVTLDVHICDKMHQGKITKRGRFGFISASFEVSFQVKKALKVLHFMAVICVLKISVDRFYNFRLSFIKS